MISTGVTLGILLAGIVVVIGSVLFFRMHAFLALILGALVVAALTPSTAVEQYGLEGAKFKTWKGDAEAGQPPRLILGKQFLQPGMMLEVLEWNSEAGEFSPQGTLRVSKVEPQKTADGKSVKTAITIFPGETFELSDDSLIVTPTARKAAESLSNQTIGARVAQGFGNTCVKIGILIAMASIIGKCLLDSGAADKIVRSLLRLMGEKGAPFSFLSSGFLLGVPVFFDTVFYLMIPLGKAMRMRTGRNYLLYVLTIVAGATMAHSLVPPTPGPLFVAEQLGVDIGLMILAGGCVGIFTAGFGYAYASVANRIWELPLRESPEMSLAELEEITNRDESLLPPLWLALLPILLPVILIGGYTVLKSFENISPTVMHISQTLGDKNLALVISAAVAILMLIKQKKTDLKDLSDSLQTALASGGVIILITAGGGAFGAVLQQTGVSGLIRDLPNTSPTMILCLAFLITTAIRTAQGSATVAMITAVGILAGISSADILGFHPVYLALAIGCGSKPIAWMNDSGFWVITKMSGMTESEGLKYITPMTTCMGVVGLVVVLIGVQLFPLV